MSEDINIKAFKKEKKKRERKEKFHKFINETAQWIEDNKELIIIAIPVIGFTIKGGVSITKKLVTSYNLNKQVKIKENFCYDPSLGHYWELKRKLTNAEWIEIDQRKEAGERLGNILKDLGVLKK